LSAAHLRRRAFPSSSQASQNSAAGIIQTPWRQALPSVACSALASAIQTTTGQGDAATATARTPPANKHPH
jgi:hypothetical protein